jgi:putative membrane protein
MIKHLILIYLATFPLIVADRMGWWTPLFVMAIAFGFFGIEEAGVEIEDPFGLEINCLPLDALCVTIIRDTAELTRESNQTMKPTAIPHNPIPISAMVDGMMNRPDEGN